MIKTIVSSNLPVDELFRIRKNVLTNGSAQKRFCVVSGTHGDELEGQMVCYELGKIIGENMDLLNGSVEIYPALNPLGIDTIQRGIPNFDLDMNRIFPGDPQGSMAEQTAYLITEDLKGSNMVIDIHSSNLFLREQPQVRINVLNEKELVPFAEKLNIDFIWVHDAATVLEATLAHSLNSTGTPCLVVEMGVGQRINHGMCRQLEKGIFQLMFDMGIWKKSPDEMEIFNEVESHKAMLCKGDTVEFLNAEKSGIFLTEKKAGENIHKGELIGEIVSPLEGKIISTVLAPCDGYLFTIRAYPVVYEGSLMARIFKQ